MPGEKLNNNDGGNESNKWTEAMSEFNQQETPSETPDAKEANQQETNPEESWRSLTGRVYDVEPKVTEYERHIVENAKDGIFDGEPIHHDDLAANKIKELYDRLMEDKTCVVLARKAAYSKKPFFLYPKKQREQIDKGQKLIAAAQYELDRKKGLPLKETDKTRYRVTRRELTANLAKTGTLDEAIEHARDNLSRENETKINSILRSNAKDVASAALNGKLTVGVRGGEREIDIDKARAMAEAEDKYRSKIIELRNDLPRKYSDKIIDLATADGEMTRESLDKAKELVGDWGTELATAAGELNIEANKAARLAEYNYERDRQKQKRAEEKALQEAHEEIMRRNEQNAIKKVADNMASASEAEAATQFSNEQTAEWFDKVNSDEQ